MIALATSSRPAPRKSRALGLTSLLVAAVVPMGLVALLGALYAANKVTYDHGVKNALASLIVLYFFIAAPILHAIGAMVGLVGLFPRTSSRQLALFGAIANLGLIAIGVALFLFSIGLSALGGVR